MDVDGQRQHIGAGLRQGADRLAHNQVVLGDKADALGVTFPSEEPGGEGLRVETLDPFHADGDAGAVTGVKVDLAVQGAGQGVGGGGYSGGFSHIP